MEPHGHAGRNGEEHHDYAPQVPRSIPVLDSRRCDKEPRGVHTPDPHDSLVDPTMRRMTSSNSDQLRVVVVHDYLTQRGGAERVVLAIMEAFPRARLITSVYNPETTFEDFKDYRVETMWPDKIPFFRKDPRRALPFLAHAFSTHNVGQADVVVSSTSGWAHGVQTDLPTVVYCHNPARWLYQAEDYFTGLLAWGRRPFRRASKSLRRWDRESARSTSVYFANSRAVKDRIARAYGIDAALLPPPTGITSAGPTTPLVGVRPGFLLTISRARGYKNVAVACEAVAEMPDVRLLVIGDLPARPGGGEWPSNVIGVSGLTDEQMRWAYGNCAGIVAVSREDFGLTPVEGFGFGKPAALLRAGGYLDSGAPEVASVWIEEPTPEATRAGIEELLSRDWNPMAIRRHGERFSRQQFQARLQEAVLSVAAEPRGPRTTAGSGINRGRRFRDRVDARRQQLRDSASA